jgi:DNA-binding CsgD family transcriptional regulator
MNRPIFETQVEREFLLGQLSPEDRDLVHQVMQEQAVTAAQAIQMLGIGRVALGPATSLTEAPGEREFLLSQLSRHERALAEHALARNPELTVGQCVTQIRKAAEPRQMSTSKLPLSPREKQILRRLAAGKTDAQIAVQLGGTVEQVTLQRARLLAKLEVGTPAEIADAAERLASWRTYRGAT